MALPTNPTSNAGTSNVVSVAGTAGYTGTLTYAAGTTRYLISDPVADYVNANSGVAGASNLNYAAGKPPKIPGRPKISGLDKALGILGTATAAYQVLSGLKGTIKDTQAALTTAAKELGDTFSSLTEKKGSVSLEEKPDEPTFTKAQTLSNDTDWRVKIDTNWKIFNSSLFQPLADTDGLVFPFLPNITVTHKANYTAVDPIHNNYTIQGYKNSSIEDITISGEFSVSSQSEGQYWLAATTFLKTATKMFSGLSRPQGNPPIVCRLNGYGEYMFNDVPIVIKSYQVELKDSVQYRKIDFGIRSTWVPALSTITVVVAPVYNNEKMRKFSLQNYAQGGADGVL